MKLSNFPIKRIILASALAAFYSTAQASDHRDSPYTLKHPRADIGDVFLFHGTQTGGLAMAMTLNPLSGSGTEGTLPSDKITLSPELVYIFNFDTDNDARADVAYKIKAGEATDGQKQHLELRRAIGAEARDNQWTGIVRGQGETTVLNQPLKVVHGKMDELLFVGPRRDPFFFDFLEVDAPVALAITQALAGGDHLPAAGSSDLAFGRTDMTLIVLEVPDMGKEPVNFWVTVAEKSGKTVDRMGRAGIQGIYLVDAPTGYNPEYYTPRNAAKYPTVGDLNDAYNASAPHEDRPNYSEQFTYRFRQLEVSQDTLSKKVDFYLPDMIHWDPKAKPGYPNGRNLREDAIFWTLQDLNPFLQQGDGTDLPSIGTQRMSDRFPYVAPSINQEFKPGSQLEPVHPIFMK
ncbi:protein of unknown function [Sulfitobacter marinus]|uniref:DUF4331 domain-containing protein n=1 Tax=Sulfitobacter marinus TaxID=394264 RepID=A0A1I6Q0D3_9RHOB|nr:DUF4331 family protein [Sulfitobacter marinus]SFS45883.1 protein of unknown function [Sulfitobacter marinus]